VIDFKEYDEYLKMDGKERENLTQIDIDLLIKILKEEVLCIIV